MSKVINLMLFFIIISTEHKHRWTKAMGPAKWKGSRARWWVISFIYNWEWVWLKLNDMQMEDGRLSRLTGTHVFANSLNTFLLKIISSNIFHFQNQVQGPQTDFSPSLTRNFPRWRQLENRTGLARKEAASIRRMGPDQASAPRVSLVSQELIGSLVG